MTETPDVSRRSDALFGQIALQLGLLSREQLREALNRQLQSDPHRPLGEILREFKLLRPEDLDRILATQKKLVSQAPAHLRTMKEDDLFGRIALRLHFCSEEQLQECLRIQDTLSKGRFLRLGDILTSKGYLTAAQVARILHIQKGLVLYCPACNTEYNVLMFKPGSSLQCYRCGSPMKVPRRPSDSDMDEALYFGEGSE